MRKRLSAIFCVIVWFALIVQFILMLQNRVTDIPETVIRYFGFFTILTNILVAVYFTAAVFGISFTNKPGMLTAITVYIFMVGTVYQVLLRHLWRPAGMQFVADELLHTIIPLLVIVYWILYEQKSLVRYGQVKAWLIYPLGYLAYTLIRGEFSGFYSYPFIDVSKIGLKLALRNSSMLALIFVLIALLFILVGKKSAAQKAGHGSK